MLPCIICSEQKYGERLAMALTCDFPEVRLQLSLDNGRSNNKNTEKFKYKIPIRFLVGLILVHATQYMKDMHHVFPLQSISIF